MRNFIVGVVHITSPIGLARVTKSRFPLDFLLPLLPSSTLSILHFLLMTSNLSRILPNSIKITKDG